MQPLFRERTMICVKGLGALGPETMAAILSRVVRSLAVAGAARSSLSSSAAFSSPSLPRRFSSPPPRRAVAVAPSDVAADVDAEGDEGLVLPAASVMKAANPSLLQPRVVVYDGVCHLCHRGVKWVMKADKHRKIKFCCLQSKAAEPYMRLCGLEKEDVLHRFLFVEGLGAYHVASTAALKVMSYLPLPYSALSALLIVPTPVRDAVYDYVAKRRYDWFGKEEDCLVLREQDMLERFIDKDEMLDRSRSAL